MTKQLTFAKASSILRKEYFCKVERVEQNRYKLSFEYEPDNKNQEYIVTKKGVAEIVHNFIDIFDEELMLEK